MSSQWHLSQDLDVAGSFWTSPNSMESMMCSSMSRPPVRIVSESEFCAGEIPALQQVGLNEDDIRRAHKMDTVATLQSFRLFPNELSRMRIPLCRLVPMPMVRPTLASDILALEQQFVYGYEEGARVFYVSIGDEESCTGVFSKRVKQEWGALWNLVNDQFNDQLRSTDCLSHLVDAKFFICDGNHRRIVWMNHITCLHSTKLSWHISVDSIILDTRNRVALAMQVMHDVNK